MEHFGFPVEVIIVFFGVIALSVYFDLVSHRNVREISIGNASKWCAFWIIIALLFYVYLWVRFDRHWADMYLAGYLLEKSLSVDNLVVFIAIFSSFGISSHLQHRILYWGIMGALAFRAVFVVIGTGLFYAAPWVGFLFATFVAWSGVQMLRDKSSGMEIEDYTHHWSVNWIGRMMPVYTRLHGERFFVKDSEIPAAQSAGAITRKGLWYATPAFLCLVAVEASDLAFAFDSVPAVISVTEEPLLVYAAMIFAILGLRTLYFVIAALTEYLVHLKKAVVALLFFIAVKMTVQSWNHAVGDTGIHISPQVSVLIVIGTLAAGVLASLLLPRRR